MKPASIELFRGAKHIQKFNKFGMTKGALPEYKAMNPELTLEALSDLINEINSGKFKLVGFHEHTENEVLELPNPGGKPFTRPTGKTVKTIEITICNQVTE